jgi:hypothetical protein
MFRDKKIIILFTIYLVKVELIRGQREYFLLYLQFFLGHLN